MSSNHFPIKAPTRQMLYPLSYRGIDEPLPWDVSTRLTVLVNRTIFQISNKRDRPEGDLFLSFNDGSNLCSASLFVGFSEHSTAIQCVVNNLANGGRFWIDVHPIARL
jgi:hypothetical protein